MTEKTLRKFSKAYINRHADLELKWLHLLVKIYISFVMTFSTEAILIPSETRNSEGAKHKHRLLHR